MFTCQNCEKVLWTFYKKLPDGKTVCITCYNKHLEETKNRQIEERNRQIEERNLQIELRKQKIQQLYDTFESKNLQDISINFMDKYHKNIDENLPKLIKLLELKYKIVVDRDIFIDVLWRIKNEYDEKKELEEFEKTITKTETKGDKKKEMIFYCSKCGDKIDEKTFFYSKDYFGKSLCKSDQGTKYQRALFSALKKRGIECEYEASDGKKHVDIAIHDAKLYLEVDGSHHSTKPDQLFSDIMRDKYSGKNGYVTKRFSNKEINTNLDKIADALVNVIEKIKQ